jgi:hypothetical protein
MSRISRFNFLMEVNFLNFEFRLWIVMAMFEHTPFEFVAQDGGDLN